MSDAIFSVRNLNKSYKKDTPVLKDISFDIPNHGITCFLGNNGAGKTTLIKCLLRLLNINSGHISFNGISIYDISASEFYKDISAVLEGNRNVYWYATGMQNIRYFGLQKGLSDQYIVNRGKELLKLFELYDSRDVKAGHYSRGMQQKLSIIISLLVYPKVLFLDEPTLGLDYSSKKTMMNILKSLSEEIPIVLSSHQLDVVDKLVDQLIIIDKHKLQYYGGAKEFKEKHSIKNRFEITISENPPEELKRNENIFIEQVDKIYKIVFKNSNQKELETAIRILNQSNLEILSIQKDSEDLEDVLINFQKKG